MTAGDPLLEHVPLPFGRRLAIGAEILATYLRVRLLMRRRDLRSTLATLRGDTGTHAPGAAELALGARLAGVVTRVLERLPWDASCLLQSLVLSGLLARREIAASLIIGVERADETFGAHAWVEVCGAPLLDPGGERFLRLVEL